MARASTSGLLVALAAAATWMLAPATTLAAPANVAVKADAAFVLVIDDDEKPRKKRRTYSRSGDNVVVDAPTTRVETNSSRTRVEAPYTGVSVGHGGSVRVRAPYVDLYVPR